MSVYTRQKLKRESVIPELGELCGFIPPPFMGTILYFSLLSLCSLGMYCMVQYHTIHHMVQYHTITDYSISIVLYAILHLPDDDVFSVLKPEAC